MATEKDEKQIKKEVDKVTASHKEKDKASQLIDKLENGEEEIQAERAERFYTLYFRKILL